MDFTINNGLSMQGGDDISELQNDIDTLNALVVHLAGTETITGNKTLSGTTTFTGNVSANSVTITPTELGYIGTLTSDAQTQINAKATDALVVHLAGTETITGDKTFSGITTFTGNISANSVLISPSEFGFIGGLTSDAQTQLTAKVSLTGAETIAGIKTFSSLPECVTSATTANQLTNKTYVDSQVGAIGAVTLVGTQTISGEKTFSGNTSITGDLTVSNVNTTISSDGIVLDSNNNITAVTGGTFAVQNGAFANRFSIDATYTLIENTVFNATANSHAFIIGGTDVLLMNTSATTLQNENVTISAFNASGVLNLTANSGSGAINMIATTGLITLTANDVNIVADCNATAYSVGTAASNKVLSSVQYTGSMLMLAQSIGTTTYDCDIYYVGLPNTRNPFAFQASEAVIYGNNGAFAGGGTVGIVIQHYAPTGATVISSTTSRALTTGHTIFNTVTPFTTIGTMLVGVQFRIRVLISNTAAITGTPTQRLTVTIFGQQV